MRIGIVAAEPSGDALAAGLMRALREELPTVRFEGVSGPRMLEAGIDSWESMDSLSVMGLFEVLRHLPRLLRLRRGLLRRWEDTPPALFIGVDAPDFNLAVETHLRERGVPTVHYVSPTVWAWRTGRVRKIRRAADLLLTILPFEKDFLAGYGVAAHYVGHPLAGQMTLSPDRAAARRELDLVADAPTLALLPGSRHGEVSRLAGPFIEAAQSLRASIPDLQVVTPLVRDDTREQFEAQCLARAPSLPVRVVTGQSHAALAAADVVLVASGTATLEALLSHRPMVVGYRVNAATYAVVRALRLIKTRHVALSNLLSEEPMAEELIQDDCVPEKLAPALLSLFRDPARRDAIAARYHAVLERLRMDSNREAARAVRELLREHGVA